MRRLLLLLLTLLFAACSHEAERITDAAVTPLEDLNLLQAKIPAMLNVARQDPYKMPSDPSCGGLDLEIRALDDALGPDLDAKREHADPGLIERGGAAVEDATVGVVHDAANVVPHRRWVRSLTGAERRTKEVAGGIVAGGIRRAFLKGLRTARSCP